MDRMMKKKKEKEKKKKEASLSHTELISCPFLMWVGVCLWLSSDKHLVGVYAQSFPAPADCWRYLPPGVRWAHLPPPQHRTAPSPPRGGTTVQPSCNTHTTHREDCQGVSASLFIHFIDLNLGVRSSITPLMLWTGFKSERNLIFRVILIPNSFYFNWMCWV